MARRTIKSVQAFRWVRSETDYHYYWSPKDLAARLPHYQGVVTWAGSWIRCTERLEYPHFLPLYELMEHILSEHVTEMGEPSLSVDRDYDESDGYLLLGWWRVMTKEEQAAVNQLWKDELAKKRDFKQTQADAEVAQAAAILARHGKRVADD